MVGENSQSAAVDQYTANSDSLTDVLNTANSTLNSVTTLLQHAVSLGVEGANGTMNQTDLNSIASEVSGIQEPDPRSRQHLLRRTVPVQRHCYRHRSLCRRCLRSVSNRLSSATAEQNQVQIGTGLSVAANLPGSSIFSQSGANVFTALQALITALQSETPQASPPPEIASAVRSTPSIPPRSSTATRSTNSPPMRPISPRKRSTSPAYENTLVSADTATAATDVTQAETVLNATIAAAAQVNQQANLLDYIQDYSLQ